MYEQLIDIRKSIDKYNNQELKDIILKCPILENKMGKSINEEKEKVILKNILLTLLNFCYKEVKEREKIERRIN